MKKMVYILSLLAAGILSSQLVQAADEIKSVDLVKQEIQLTITALELQRKSSIALGLQLSAEDMGFWSVYNAYRAKMRKVIDTRAEIITDYADAYQVDNLTDKDASKLLDRYLTNLAKQVKVKKDFVRKFKKVLSAKKVARFYQLDHRIDLIVNLQIAGEIPLVE